MDKQQIVDSLNRVLLGVQELRGMNYSNGALEPWKNKVHKVLADAYGQDSSQSKRFENAPGKFFKVDTELGRQQSYTYVLEMHESALNTLIQRAEMG